MAYEEKYKKADMPHNVIMEGRESLSISGVEDVESFDENAVVMHTTKGLLEIRGKDLQIEKLSLDGGEVNIEGFIESLIYEEESKEKGSFWSRMFR